VKIGNRAVLDVLALQWCHDKVLCPEHSLALDQLLAVSTGP
jgi:hypothetical protein